MRKLTVLILAAGEGTRMKSKKAKVLHQVGGLPILEFVVRSARAMSEDVRVVVGHQADAVREAVKGVTFIQQERQLGTGHAVMAAHKSLSGADGDVLILPGDVPLIQPGTLQSFTSFHADGGFSASVMTASVDDPHGYGRVIRNSEKEVDRIVEHRDSDSETLKIQEINSGIYLVGSRLLFDALERTGNKNAQREYYLTDIFRIISGEGNRVGAFKLKDADEATGINSRKELSFVDRQVRRRKCQSLMAEGVSILDPETARIDVDVQIGADSIVYPSVAIEGRSALGEDVTVRSFSRITNCRIGNRSTILDGSILADSEIGEDVQVGPHARLRPGVILENRVRIGNFVEVKKSRLDEGTKAGHLAYLGDAEIGRDVNIGAGTITCNYDGQSKHPTIIEDGVFIGSNSSLVAPVRIGRNSYVGAGSTITEDVPPDSLAIGRGRQVVKQGWVKKNKKE
jgi:bifunctional UDP-N-acetylglucosamine pyrophosphorylase/glucosamine-1-phosphate N-acetyltransferase